MRVTCKLSHRYGVLLVASAAAVLLNLQASAAWAETADELCAEHSTAETTALAVTVFADLNRQLEDASGGEASLDSLLPALVDSDVDLDSLIVAAEQLAGTTPDALHIENLPGCRKMP